MLPSQTMNFASGKHFCSTLAGSAGSVPRQPTNSAAWCAYLETIKLLGGTVLGYLSLFGRLDLVGLLSVLCGWDRRAARASKPLSLDETIGFWELRAEGGST